MFEEEEGECTVRIRNFSDENIHIPGSEAAVEIEAGEVELFLHVFANGMNAEDEGYVTIDFRNYMDLYSQSSCVVSVLDASGNRRFPTSYVFCPEREHSVVVVDEFLPFIMDRIMKRKTLLEEPDELLPEDCLTLHLHIFTKDIIFGDEFDLSAMSFELPSVGGQYVRLYLDSVAAKRLIGVSSYFRALSEAPMVERQRGYARFSQQEYELFRNVCNILLGEESISINSVYDLIQISDIADKYDVPPVVESCRGILSVLLRAAENEPVIEEFVKAEIMDFEVPFDEFSDSRLKEIFESFLERNRKYHNEDNRPEYSAADQLETEWRLYHFGEEYPHFTFVRDAQSREDEFEFYQ